MWAAFRSSPLRSPIARSSIRGFFFLSLSFHKHPALGLAPTGSLEVAFCLGSIGAVESQSKSVARELVLRAKGAAGARLGAGSALRASGHREVSMRAQPPVLRELRQRCSSGTVWSWFVTPPCFQRVFGGKRNVGFDLLCLYQWGVTPGVAKRGDFCQDHG